MGAFFLHVSSPALRVFPGALLFLRFLCPGDWRFAFPGDSRFLAIRVSWRFPPGDYPHVLAGRALVVLQFNDTIKSRFLVAFGAPTPSSLLDCLISLVNKCRGATDGKTEMSFYTSRPRPRNQSGNIIKTLDMLRKGRAALIIMPVLEGKITRIDDRVNVWRKKQHPVGSSGTHNFGREVRIPLRLILVVRSAHYTCR